MRSCQKDHQLAPLKLLFAAKYCGRLTAYNALQHIRRKLQVEEVAGDSSHMCPKRRLTSYHAVHLRCPVEDDIAHMLRQHDLLADHLLIIAFRRLMSVATYKFEIL